MFMRLFLLLKFLFCIGLELINSVVLVSGVQRSDSVIPVRVSILRGFRSLLLPSCHLARSATQTPAALSASLDLPAD